MGKSELNGPDALVCRGRQHTFLPISKRNAGATIPDDPGKISPLIVTTLSPIPTLSMKDTQKIYDKNDKSRNPDLITGAPGSHPIGTGLGAVAGGAAAGAAAGTVAGPVGTVAGAAVGAIVGGLAGKGVAEAVNPTEEAAYWRENHRNQPYAKGRSYDEYGRAYQTGYDGFAEYGETGATFEEREAELRKRYEATGSKLAWNDARPASYAAWKRLQD